MGIGLGIKEKDLHGLSGSGFRSEIILANININTEVDYMSHYPPHRSCAFGALAARTRSFYPGHHFLDGTGTVDVSQQRQGPLQAPGRPSPALTTRPTPPLEGALLVAIRADPRASKPQELPVAVPQRAPLNIGTADVSQ